ncbi:hypothetical protein TNCV_1514051 [Trichonephila clavipes]|nr:hypothetical protein TNCV_1514051 [Trichonephila clavipes]
MSLILCATEDSPCRERRCTLNLTRLNVLVVWCGRGSLVVKASARGWNIMSSSPLPLKTNRVGERCTLNLPRAQTSSRWCGLVVRRSRGRETIPAQVSSTSIDNGSKLRGPSPKALVQLNSATSIFPHSPDVKKA